MNIIKYLCNLNELYLALIINSSINQIINESPSINETGIFYTLFRVDAEKGNGMSKSIYINTALRTSTKLFAFTDIEVFIAGADISPLRSSHIYDKTKGILTFKYEVMI